VFSSSVIGSGGLGLHPLVIRAVMVLVSVCTFCTWSPFSPVISIGLSPVCCMMSILRLRSPFGVATSICTFSCVGGCMVVGSGV
jgi:hypothetical protein